MRGVLRILAIGVVGMLLYAGAASAESESAEFEVILFLTRQDDGMDWWHSIPDRFYPQLTVVSAVTKNEYFKILPVFSNYGVSAQDEADITYDLEIIKPDGTAEKSMKSLEGVKGAVHGGYVLPSSAMLHITFGDEFPYGDYTIRVTATDHVKNQTAHADRAITLKEFQLQKFEGSWEEWCLGYAVAPNPSEALSAFLSASEPYLIGRTLPIWSTVWFYKCILEDNPFLLSHAVKFYTSEADLKQRKDILLLFYLLNKTELIPISQDLAAYAGYLKGIKLPDPYGKITSGDQLDMLWAEFFATARIRPIRQLLTAMNLYVHAGVLDKVKSGELKKTDSVEKEAELDAVFRSALWSIRSNCEQSQLVYQFCSGLYESGKLNEKEKGYLGAILHDIPVKEQDTGREEGLD